MGVSGGNITLQIESAASLPKEIPYLRDSSKSALHYIRCDMENIQGLV
jgi:hypothetical protein